MNVNTPVTQFSHRAISEDNPLPIDLYATIEQSVANIQVHTELLNSNNPVTANEETRDQLLKQIELSSLDILSITEHFINTHEITKIDDECAANEANETNGKVDRETYLSLVKHLATGDEMGFDAVSDLKNNGNTNETAIEFSGHIADYFENNKYDHSRGMLMNFLTKVFKVIPVNKDNGKESSSALITTGGSFADIILSELSQIKNENDLHDIAESFSESMAKYANISSPKDNQLVLMGLFEKLLKAGIPEVDETEKSS